MAVGLAGEGVRYIAYFDRSWVLPDIDLVK